MHEHGLVDRLLSRAVAVAREQGGTLRRVHVRLGAMATIDADRLRADVAHIAGDHLGLHVEVVVEEAPDRPSGVELVAVDVAR